jgi:hypothetical protein
MTSPRLPSDDPVSKDRFAAPAPPRALAEILSETEQRLDADVRRRSQPGSAGPDPRLPALAAELEAAAARVPTEATRYARRLRAVRARLALCVREVPAGALDGLYEDVCAATDDVSPWARSRMSDAFLDAPQHLVRWRSTALAACALLALGAGLFAGGRLGFDDEDAGRSLERVDRRNDLLPRLDTAGFLPPAKRRARSPGTLISDPGANNPGSNARGLTRSRSGRSGLFLWYGPAREPAEAQRRLDAVGVQIFPVGAPVDGVEQN